MPFYENFTMKNPTSFGTKMAAKEADNVLKAIISHRSKVDFSIGIGTGTRTLYAGMQAPWLGLYMR